MKSKVLIINKEKRRIITVVFLMIVLVCVLKTFSKVDSKTNNINTLQKSNNSINKSIVETSNTKENTITTVNLEAYKNMPEEIEGYKVIGKIEIPKIDLTTYILNETTKESLDIAVTKICGPDVNKTGNLCIAGHNYNSSKMFGKLKKLEENDEIIITDIYDRSKKYIVYKIEKVKPTEIECLQQDTQNEVEVTLITCTLDGTRRLVIKAVEDYD